MSFTGSGGRRILIVGGGTAGWLTAAYLGKALGPGADITLLESPEIGVIGVGEGTFPTIRATLKFLGIDEAAFLRETSATFKQGIRFADWLHAPDGDRRHSYVHPFEAPFQTEFGSLVPYWLAQAPGTRAAFAEAVTIQARVADAGRAPKTAGDGNFDGPLAYAFHCDAVKLAGLLSRHAIAGGVAHVADVVTRVEVAPDGAIAGVQTRDHGRLEADLYIDCTGFRAELIGRALGEPIRSVRDQLFTDRAITAKLPYPRATAPLASYTLATAHEGGWIWDIGLADTHGVGCVYSSAHLDDERAAAILHDYLGVEPGAIDTRSLAFEPGYRARQWIGNCVAVGLAGGFLEPLEATGIVMIEAAAAMIAELLPPAGPVAAPARRFNALMAARYDTIVTFLKLHYALSRRREPFWRDNADPATWPAGLAELLDQWRYRPPGRFDFTLDTETFAFFNYQYVLYGMDFGTVVAAGRNAMPGVAGAERQFARIRSFGERAMQDLPPHRDLVERLRADPGIRTAATE
ncbi:tryptophan halogenase family protein [Sphingomonas hylomeconis]|uniref:Tryptophan halogenase family protein n=1 Tax=Sphingomonas hylomeconis TaxID=1395958 RepID=A0ABV7SWL6_9SPHN|nr:tryptophan halogenase family protein [Sphingomonas hylomeconis]